MSSQQFNLRWNNHTSNLIQVFFDQFEHEQMVDVTITCQGKFIKAHKMVLSACSPYFQEIFDRHGSTPHPVIIMNGLKFEDIKSIVEFMYKGEVKVCESDLEGLLSAAEYLQIKGLSNVRSTRPSQSHGNSGSHSSTGNNSLQQENSNRKNASQSSSSLSLNSANSSRNSTPHYDGMNNEKGLNVSESANETAMGTPLHLRRKRAKPANSPSKEVGDSPVEQGNFRSENMSQAVLQGVANPMEDESSDDLPLTIRIEPPYIRDIDEEEEEDWDVNNRDRTKVPETLDAANDGKAGSLEPKEKIPRPPNAFMIFANEWRRKLATQHPSESNKEISVRLGIMWKNLSGDSKEEYFAASRQANEDHKKKYPDYYYSPKEARLRKRWKMQQQHVSQLMSSGQYNPVHLVKVFMNDEEDGVGDKQSAVAQPTTTT